MRMPTSKKAWLAANLVGGPAVLGSYMLLAGSDADTVERLWAVPSAIRTAYTTNMFLAAAGYLSFFAVLLFRVDAKDARVNGRFGFRSLAIATAILLFCSALWMPLSLEVIRGAEALRPLVYLVLWGTALASLWILAALWTMQPQPKGRLMAVIGAAFFCLQTVVLDGVLWPIWF